MQTTAEKTVLITGANVGSAKRSPGNWHHVPRRPRIYLACRNQDRAATAKAELEAKTGRRIFDIVLMDVSDPGSVRAGLAGIDGSIDALVMNAGGMGGKTPMALTADGATYISRRTFLATLSSSRRSWPRTGLARWRSSPEARQPGESRKWGSSGRRSTQTPPTSSPPSSTAAISPAEN